MGRPRSKTDPAAGVMREAAKELEAAGYLETGSGMKVEREPLTKEELADLAGRTGLSPLDELELRVAELEQRVAEAGRWALFHAQHGGSRVSPAGPMLADVGRALLFDSETPNEEQRLGLEGHRVEVDAQAGVAGTAEVERLGGDAA